MNRSADARTRQEKKSSEQGQSLSLTKAEFLHVDFANPNLNLNSVKFDELASKVDIILHNAWKVDFNQTLESFDTHIRGVRNFVDFSTKSRRQPHIFFVSSITSVERWNNLNQGPVPETPLDDCNLASEMGYGESKHVAEQILAAACLQSSVPVTILRVGQLAGPVAAGSGAWPRDEWVPSLLLTSKALGMIPDYVPPVNWIPIDMAANIILEILHSPAPNTPSQAHVYNLVNPQLTPWSSLLPAIKDQLGAQVRVVPSVEWVNTIANLDAANAQNLADYPALKILDFFQAYLVSSSEGTGASQWETKNGVTASKTMAELGPVSGEWMELWMRQLGV